MTLKELRKSRKMTLEQVSVGTNISQSTISKLERGQLPLHEDNKNALENFYGESFEYVEVPTYTEYLKLKEQYEKLQQDYNDLMLKYQTQFYDLQDIKKIALKY